MQKVYLAKPQGDQDIIVVKNRNFFRNKIEIFVQNNC